MGSPKKYYEITFEAFRNHCAELTKQTIGRGPNAGTIERLCNIRMNQLTKEPYCRETNCPVMSRLVRVHPAIAQKHQKQRGR